jgi:hypothetical protein
LNDLINIRYKEISLNIKERWKVSLSLHLLLLEEVLVVEVRIPLVELEYTKPFYFVRTMGAVCSVCFVVIVVGACSVVNGWSSSGSSSSS